MVITGKIIGVQEINYTNKNGNPVVGRSLHFGYGDTHTVGFKTGSVYISDRDFGGLAFMPDDTIRVALGRGYCEFIEKVGM